MASSPGQGLAIKYKLDDSIHNNWQCRLATSKLADNGAVRRLCLLIGAVSIAHIKCKSLCYFNTLIGLPVTTLNTEETLDRQFDLIIGVLPSGNRYERVH